MQSESLFLIGHVCDEDCIALFDDKVLNIYMNDNEIRHFLSTKKQDNLVLQGIRNKQDGLYDVPFPHQ